MTESGEEPGEGVRRLSVRWIVVENSDKGRQVCRTDGRCKDETLLRKGG